MPTTRNQTNAKVDKDWSTDFVLHKSQQTVFRGIQNKIIDYTEHRLVRYAKSVIDLQQKLILMAMIDDYRNGNIAVAWKKGLPIYVKVIKST